MVSPYSRGECYPSRQRPSNPGSGMLGWAMPKRRYDDKMKLDMPFGEALDGSPG